MAAKPKHGKAPAGRELIPIQPVPVAKIVPPAPFKPQPVKAPERLKQDRYGEF